MNWKNEAMDKLRRYDSMRTACHSIPKELQRLRVEACRMKGASTDPVPVKGGSSRGEDRLLNNIVLRQELSNSLERTRAWLDVTERALKHLDRQEQLILQRLYIYPEKGGVDRLCQELGMEKSTVYRHRDRALEKFTLALYGLPEPWQVS